MRDFLIRVKNTFLSKKFIGFCLIGIVNTFNTAFFSWLAHLKIQENISAYIGYFRFLLSYVPNLLIYTLASMLTINVLKINQFWATAIATAVGGPITFVIIKLFAFEGLPKKEDIDT